METAKILIAFTPERDSDFADYARDAQAYKVNDGKICFKFGVPMKEERTIVISKEDWEALKRSL